MGNCGSAVDCDRCYSSRKIPGCDTNIHVNPDIAGIGVIVSFFISALSICLSVAWYYYREALPSQLLVGRSNGWLTDHHVLRLLKKRRLRFDDADVDYEVSESQQRRSRTVIGYLKVLGTQQLMTGFAIIIAGLASRCEISFYEFNIVANLAYLAAFTHLCSMHLIREYLHEHTTARTWHVVFTAVFAILLCFVSIINSTSYDLYHTMSRDHLNHGNAVQCFFEAYRLEKSIQLEVYASVAICSITIVSHVWVISSLYSVPASDFTTSIVHRIMAKSLRRSGLNDQDRHNVVNDSEVKYWAWLRPPGDGIRQPAVSAWWFIENYHSSELSFLSTMIGLFVCGTSRIVVAVWYGGLKPSNELRTLGFGQVVALGLLALTLLSVVEIYDEERVIDKKTTALTPSPTPSTHTSGVPSVDVMIQHHRNESDTTGHEEPTAQVQGISALPATNPPQPKPYRSFLERLVHLWVPKTSQDLLLIKQNPHISYFDHPFVALRTAQWSCLQFACFTVYCISIGVDWNSSIDSGFSIPLAFIFYMFYRVMLMAKRICNQIYFVLEDIDARKHQAGIDNSSTAPTVRYRRSVADSSISVATIRSAPVDLEQGASNLVRRDTEADIGLVSLARRQTYPQRQE